MSSGIRGFFSSKKSFLLLTQAEGFDDGAVALDVFSLHVVEQRAALTYELYQCAFSRMIFTVLLHVLRQVGNTVGEQSHLALNRTSVRVGLSVLSKDLLLLS